MQPFADDVLVRAPHRDRVPVFIVPLDSGYLLSEKALEAIGFAAILMTLTGVWLQWHGPNHLSEVEEALKDGRLLPEEAESRTRKIERRAMIWVIAGMVLLVSAGIEWLRRR